MPSPSSPSSPSSSSSQPPVPQYPLPLTQAYLYDTYRRGALHLVPCTFDQYFELPYGNEDKYELVEGILWWKGEMATHSHDETRDRIAAEIFRRHRDRGCEVLVERTVYVSGSSSHVATRSTEHSSSSASNQHTCTIRRPDVTVFERGRAPNRGDLSPRSQKITFPRDHPPLLALEVTSPSTRSVDLSSKWDEYERAKVRCYVIIDRANETDQSVIVGTLSANGTYRKHVYRGDDVVRGLLFDDLGFSAQYVLDPPRSVTEIHDSPIRKLKGTIRDRDRTIEENNRTIAGKDRAIEEKNLAIAGKNRTIEENNRTIAGKNRTIKDQAGEITDLKQQVAVLMEGKRSTSKAHGSTEKQGGSSSSPKSPAAKGVSPSKGNSPSKGHSPSKPSKPKKSRLKK